MANTESSTPDHVDGVERGEDFADEPTETKGPTDRPVGKVEGDPMSETTDAMP